MKINTQEHNNLVEVIEKYDRFYDLYGDLTVSEQQDKAIRNQISEFQRTYDYYNILLSELRRCIHDYHSIRKTLKTNI